MTTKGLLGWAASLLSGLPYERVDVSAQPINSVVRDFGGTVRWDSEKELYSIYARGLLGGSPKWAYLASIEDRNENWVIRKSGSVANGLPEFNLTKFEAKFLVEQGVTGKLQWSNGIAMSTRTYENAPSTAAFADGTAIGFQSKLDYDLLRLPEKRVFMNVGASSNLGQVFGVIQSFAKFQGFGRLQWITTANPKALELSLGASSGGIAGQAPFDEYYMLGMQQDSYLWLRGHVATYDGRKGNAPIGRDYVLTQLDLSKPLYQGHLMRWQVGPFVDSGNVGGVFGSNGWLFDAGVESKLRVRIRLTLRLIAGHDLVHGGTVFYTAVTTR